MYHVIWQKCRCKSNYISSMYIKVYIDPEDSLTQMTIKTQTRKALSPLYRLSILKQRYYVARIPPEILH